VQLVGHGSIVDHYGANTTLTHPSHRTFHHTPLSTIDEDMGKTRFVRWHIDAALYERGPPRVTALYAVEVPGGQKQTVVYDDGSGDELEVPRAATAIVSGRTMFDVLSPALKSLAIRTRVKVRWPCYVA
jgi:alpha-ketoglutarate-dependent taurine dioxygenase